MSGRVRGWCPSLFEPMASGDGLLARIKPPLGRLSADGLRAVASAAEAFGAGQLELTNRAALQVRGLSEASLPPFQAAVLAAGLASPDPAVERRRNLVVSPFASPEELALAVELERWITQDGTLADLPSKVGFAVAGFERPIAADIGLSSLPFMGREDVAWRVDLGGEIEGLTQTPLTAIRAIIRNFIQLSGAAADRPRRMAELVRRCGAAAVLAGADVDLIEARPTPDRGAPAIAGPFGESFALGMPFGAADARRLHAAADLADRFADGWVRLSPWRALVLGRIGDASGLAAAARAAGFITDPADPRLAVTACPGAPACSSGHAAARADAARLADLALPRQVHVSGCAKGCAHPGPAPLTLVAGADGYGLVRDGRASDPPQARGLTLESVVRLLAVEPP